MSERQEKVWIVTRRELSMPPAYGKPVKAFDDRKDGRAYCKRYNASARRYVYRLVGVKQG